MHTVIVGSTAKRLLRREKDEAALLAVASLAEGGLKPRQIAARLNRERTAMPAVAQKWTVANVRNKLAHAQSHGLIRKDDQGRSGQQTELRMAMPITMTAPTSPADPAPGSMNHDILIRLLAVVRTWPRSETIHALKEALAILPHLPKE